MQPTLAFKFTHVETTMHTNTQNNAPRRFLFLLASSRADGNTEQLARYAAQSLPDETEQVWLRLPDLDMPEFEDKRHSGDGKYLAPEGKMAQLLHETLSATDIVFVTPLYWYSLPTPAKKYLDHWSGWMRVPELNFLERMAGRNMWNVTVTADEDQSFAQPLIEALRLCANYAEMPWRGALIGYGNRPGEVMQHEKSVHLAREFFV
jgi:multimeric flavodoxin WrbA